jgi:CO/xanthine dehydrogenase Mo-binding subunit
MPIVLMAAAAKFRRRFEKTPSKRGFCIACADYKGTYVATMAEIKVDKRTGSIKVEMDAVSRLFPPGGP